VIVADVEFEVCLFSILIYVRHAIECKFRGDALPNYEDISVKVDLQNLEVGSR
jgi:hypothetical protein